MTLGISLTQPGQEGNQKLMKLTLPCKSALDTGLPCRSDKENAGVGLLSGIRTMASSAPIMATAAMVMSFFMLRRIVLKG